MLMTILRIRARQFMRILAEIGVVLFVLLLVVLFPLVMGVLAQLSDMPPMWAVGIVLVLIFSIHLNRQDKDFVKLILQRPFLMFLMEYVVLILPIVVWLAYSRAVWALLALIVGVVVVACVPVTVRFRKREHPFWRFPKNFTRHYEWMSGLRKSAVWMIPTYLLGAALSGFTAAIPVALMVLGFITLDFYMDCEPRIFLELYSRNARSFLRKKIIAHLWMFWLACLPLVILFLVFHYEYWYVLLVVMFVVSVLPILSITLKYASYQPNIRLTQNVFTMGLMVVFLCTPFTQPVPLVMTVIYYRRALMNLKKYM